MQEQELTVHRADFVAHRIADEIVVGVKHHKDLVHGELLGGGHHPRGLIMNTALESDGLTPLVASGLDLTVRKRDGILAVRGGSDHWKEEECLHPDVSKTIAANALAVEANGAKASVRDKVALRFWS